MKYHLIACEILFREICAVVARSPNLIDVTFLPKGLHDIGQQAMSRRLGEVLAEVDETGYDAILWGYGLCNNGLVGLAARTIPLVLPRAHDCITLFLGDKQRYLDYFHANPGVYFQTTGWIERGGNIEQYPSDSVQKKNGMGGTYEEFVEKYGEDNARFLYEQLREMTHNYAKITFIEMGIEPDDRFEREAREKAKVKGWRFEKLAGEMTLIKNLIDGNWDEEHFLVVPPGHQVAPSYDELIIKAVPTSPPLSTEHGS